MSSDYTNEEIETLFSQWYALYPRKISPRAALRAFRIVLERGYATPFELCDGARKYAERVRTREKKYIKHPSSWLLGWRVKEPSGSFYVDDDLV